MLRDVKEEFIELDSKSKSGYSINYYNLTSYLIENNYILYNDNLYLYENGVYREVNPQTFCNSILPNGGAGKTDKEKLNILERCKCKDLIKLSVDDTETIFDGIEMINTKDYFCINCLNCLVLVHRETAELRTIKHHPYNIFFQQIPFNYNPKAKRDNFSMKYLKNIELNGEDVVRLLFEILGATIGRICDKSVYLVVGCKDSGKSTLCQVINQLLGGGNNVTYHNLVDINPQSMVISDMLDAYLNISDDNDLDFTASNATYIKSLSGGPVPVEFKRKFEKNKKGIFKCKLMMTSNDGVRFTYSSRDVKALRERFITLPLNVATPKEEQVKDIFTKLNYEYWLKCAIVGLQCLIKNNYQYTKCRDEVFYFEEDPFQEWFNESLTVTDNTEDAAIVANIHDGYVEYCTDNHFEPMKSGSFHRKIKKLLNREPVTKRINGKLYKVYVGVKLDVAYDDDYIYEK